jgi:AraC family transcriptional activator of pyochelin receptor
MTKVMFKNITKDSVQHYSGEEGDQLKWLVADHTMGTDGTVIPTVLAGEWVQFFFHLGGGKKMEMIFKEINYDIPLESGSYFFLYHPKGVLDMDVSLGPGSRLVAIYIHVNFLHQLMVNDSEELSFLSSSQGHKKYYIKKEITPTLSIALSQMFEMDKSSNAMELFRKAKVYEILSICLNKGKEPEAESCPFLKDTANVEKIRAVKHLLTKDLSRTYTISELSREIGISEYNLKIGFKNVYGKPVQAYLNDYKMEVSRQLLKEGGAKVNEVADVLGYKTSSHFIESFKKRFGQTPKQYASGANISKLD